MAIPVSTPPIAVMKIAVTKFAAMKIAITTQPHKPAEEFAALTGLMLGVRLPQTTDAVRVA